MMTLEKDGQKRWLLICKYVLFDDNMIILIKCFRLQHIRDHSDTSGTGFTVG